MLEKMQLRQVNLIYSSYTFDNIVMKSILGILRALNIEQSFVIGIILGKQEFWFFVMLIFVYLPIKRTWEKKNNANSTYWHNSGYAAYII